ncbi:MAG: TIM barrel protein, partial [Victivallales bacterium]|nr:TIM barrel protein [Victivallales bacterium]
IRYVTFSHGGDFTQIAPEVLGLCRQAGKTSAQHGFQFTYHNHAAEFAPYEGRPALDYLYENTNPSQVMAELDVYWIAKGGEDPVKYIERYASRLPQLHLKDMDRADGSFTELGQGCIDLAACIDAAKKSICQWVIYEQDVCKRDPFESAAMSLEHLNRLLKR